MSAERKHIIIISDKDNVAVAVDPLPAGRKVALPDGREIVARGDIPASHKIALRDIPKGESVYRYGDPIGYATTDIFVGDWVHVHNLDAIDIMISREGESS